MPGYYTYVLSSLPMLQFGKRPPFSFERFLQMCEGLVSEDDMELLKMAPRTGEFVYEGGQETMRRWYIFDTALRNELVKIRAGRKRIDPHKYMREEVYAEPRVVHAAMNANRQPSPLEAERMLDEEKWNALDELEGTHCFDIDSLIVYAHKLLLLERWQRINAADRPRVLEEQLKKG